MSLVSLRLTFIVRSCMYSTWRQEQNQMTLSLPLLRLIACSGGNKFEMPCFTTFFFLRLTNSRESHEFFVISSLSHLEKSLLSVYTVVSSTVSQTHETNSCVSLLVLSLCLLECCFCLSVLSFLSWQTLWGKDVQRGTQDSLSLLCNNEHLVWTLSKGREKKHNFLLMTREESKRRWGMRRKTLFLCLSSRTRTSPREE